MVEDESSTAPRSPGESAYVTLREAITAGLAVLVPLGVTLAIVNVVVGYVLALVDPIANALRYVGVPEGPSLIVARLSVLSLFFLAVLLVGLATKLRYGEHLVDIVDVAIASIPGIGSIYDSFRQMSDVIVESDAKNFRDVKLVEFPHEGAYTLGFLTTETPEPLAEAVGREDMVTLFLPLAPNPVMGGHLVHIPDHRVMDVDMTVEEGIRTIVTSGAGVDVGEGEDQPTLSPEQLEALGLEREPRNGRSPTEGPVTPDSTVDNGPVESDGHTPPVSEREDE